MPDRSVYAIFKNVTGIGALKYRLPGFGGAPGLHPGTVSALLLQTQERLLAQKAECQGLRLTGALPVSWVLSTLALQRGHHWKPCCPACLPALSTETHHAWPPAPPSVCCQPPH